MHQVIGAPSNHFKKIKCLSLLSLFFKKIYPCIWNHWVFIMFYLRVFLFPIVFFPQKASPRRTKDHFSRSASPLFGGEETNKTKPSDFKKQSILLGKTVSHKKSHSLFRNHSKSTDPCCRGRTPHPDRQPHRSRNHPRSQPQSISETGLRPGLDVSWRRCVFKDFMVLQD